jgi:D-alanine-D-alanine ligase-like ATP-grasp enzyme
MKALRSQARYRLQARADLVRAVGLRHAWRRVRADHRHRRALLERAPRVAEQMWREAAAELGAEVRPLAPTLLEFSLDGATTRIRGQTTPLADPVSTEIAENKALAYQVLAEAGLPVPVHQVVGVENGGSAIDVPGPWIIKPVGSGGGAGVTGEVRTPAQLRRALVHAWKFDTAAIVEQQADGDTYRLLVLDGKLLDVLRRTRPRITGDGHSTIEELIFREYSRRIGAEGPSGLKHFAVDLDCLFTLERAGRRIDSVLGDGESVVIKTATNYNGPRETETVRGLVPAGLRDAATAAAAALGVRLAGVDIVMSDPARPLAEGGGVVLEANPVPGLTHHYNVADAAGATRIAVPILRALLT